MKQVLGHRRKERKERGGKKSLSKKDSSQSKVQTNGGWGAIAQTEMDPKCGIVGWVIKARKKNQKSIQMGKPKGN